MNDAPGIVRTIETKFEAISAVEHKIKSKSEIARQLSIPSNTLSTWINKRGQN